MRWALPLALFVATGCDLVFQLGDRVEPDAAITPDVLDIDALTPCVESSATVLASADSMLIAEGTNCDPANRSGAGQNINLGQPAGSTRSRVILRFPLTAPMIETIKPGGGFSGATLSLPLKPNQCGGPCQSSAIEFSVFAVDDDWNEGAMTGHIGASWCMRKQTSTAGGTEWEVHGADGAMDRSQLSLGDIAVTPAQAMVDVLDVSLVPTPASDNLRDWLNGARISLLLVPTTTTGMLYIKAREDLQSDPARLTIRTCR